MTRLDDYNERRKLAAAKKAAKKPARLKQTRKKRLPLPPAVYAEKIAGRSCRLCDRLDVEAHHLVDKKHFAHDDPMQHHADNVAGYCVQHHSGHTSSMHKIPASSLTADELRFVVWAKGEAWLQRNYA